jgi:allantoicase
MSRTDPLPDFAREGIDLAQPCLGTRVLAVSDEFFAPAERMLQPGPPRFIEGKYDEHGKWMDGWETRRRRDGGEDWAIIELGRPGRIDGLGIDTSHFTGNYPPAVSVQAFSGGGRPDMDSDWQPLLPVTALEPDRPQYFAVDSKRVWTHLRIRLHPDGGIARLRVYGELAIDWSARRAEGLVDLAALENGGRAIAWNDAHFGHPSNLLKPGRGVNMGDGWETRRRREPGNDWCLIALGHAGVIEEIEVDTAFFKGNFPAGCSVQAAFVEQPQRQALVTRSMFWPELLPRQPLSADAQACFRELNAVGAVTHLRFNIFPDGGVSRLRVRGRVDD